MKYILIFTLPVLLLMSSCNDGRHVVIILPEKPGARATLAAKELRKYIYLRTGTLPEIGKKEDHASTLVILKVDPAFADEEFSLKTATGNTGKNLIITGGSDKALLYGAYEYAEMTGIRFNLDGDVIPDEKIQFCLPDISVRRKPAFITRGILPFHDFPEGPDWWDECEYRSIICQLSKMKMNFIGFHTYPWRGEFNGEGHKPEPLVWIGKEDQFNADGSVKKAYPVLHFVTSDSTWGYRTAKTSEFLCGASQIFEDDYFGTGYMKNISFWPHTDAENLRIFNESGKLFSSAFSLAHEVGVKVCVGTETPLVIPDPLLKNYRGGELSDNEVKDLYKGIFTRITKTYPLDYYWLWTPEYWTWGTVPDKAVAGTIKDLQLAYSALNELGKPFLLATCGWVLGPPKDRTQFDKALPSDVPFSCINRGVGYTPVEKGFEGIHSRPKWSIPWMEDDPGLLVTQLWVGRIRKDALDSKKYGCDGLIGIHWRTRTIGPNLEALARAPWEIDKYSDRAGSRDLQVTDFYSNWVKSEFGVADTALVNIFSFIDSRGSEMKEGYKGDSYLNAADWIRGPGSLMTNRSLGELKERIGRYGFLDRMNEYMQRIKGAGNLKRFGYWFSVLSFNKAALEAAFTQARLDTVMKKIKAISGIGERREAIESEALPLRIELAQRWERMDSLLLSFVSTTGEMGTIANLEMHNIRKDGYLKGYDEYLSATLGKKLPDAVNPSREYRGRTRIIVTSGVPVINKGDELRFRVRILSESKNLTGKIYYRNLGGKEYLAAELARISRNVFEVRLPPSVVSDDIEYYIEVNDSSVTESYPATAGMINNTVVVL
ncbi:MAG TPA: hypothetical protein VMT63_07840 [Bacteroidales bacterium]|nr:hypothetical protein [Bacteroidales bacterium]